MDRLLATVRLSPFDPEIRTLKHSVISSYFVSAPSITIVGKPSAALAKKLEKDEKSRIKAQRDALGESGLAEKVKE